MPREAVYTLKIDTRQAQAEYRRFLTDMQRQTQSSMRTMTGPMGVTRQASAATSNPLAALASMRAMTAAVTGFAGALGVMQAARTAVHLADMGTEAKRTAAAFEYISGGAQAAADNLAAMDRASGGALDSLEAQRLATTALNLGLAKNATELERVTTISRGIVAVSPVINDMQGAFSELSLTLANMSWRRLDQLGLSVEEVRAKYDALREADAALSDQAAFSQAVLDTAEQKFGELAKSAEMSATGMERLRKQWKELQRETAEQASGPVNAVANWMADQNEGFGAKVLTDQAMSQAQQAYNQVVNRRRMLENALEVQANMAQVFNAQGDLRSKMGADVQASMLRRQLGDITQDIVDAQLAMAKANPEIWEQAEAMGALTDAINPAAQAYNDLTRAQGQFRNTEAMKRGAPDPYFSGSNGPSYEFQNRNFGSMNVLADLIRKADRAVEEGIPNADTYAEKLRAVADEVMKTGSFTHDNLAVMSEAVRWWNMGAEALTALAGAANLAGGSIARIGTLGPVVSGFLATGGYTKEGLIRYGTSPESFAAQEGRIKDSMDAEEARFQAKLGIVQNERIAAQERQKWEAWVADQALKEWESAAEATASAWKAELESALQGIPGLFDTSPVTAEDMAAAAAGTYQEKPDEYLRQLRDEVRNGKDYAGVDIVDAATRAGIDPNLPKEEILRQFEGMWADSSLFAEGRNLDLINQDAVQAALDRNARSQSGEAAIMRLFGIEPAGGGGMGGATFTGAGGEGASGMGGVGEGMGKAIESGFKEYDFSAATKSMADSLLSAVNQEENAAAFQAVGGAAAGKVFEGFSEGVGDYDWAAAILAAIAEQMSGEYDDE